MQKLFLVFSFVLLHFTGIYGQARIDIPFSVTDGIDTINFLRVGLDTTATNGIDPHLGEYEIPPCPPGSFLAAFDLYPYTGSQILTFRDYRDAPSFPFTGTREHKLNWQLSYGAASFTIFYNFPEGVFANLKDPFGGVIYNVNLTDSGSYIVPSGTQLMRAILTMHYNNVGGDPAGPTFWISANSLNFPPTTIGSDTTLPVTVKNMGNANTLSITNILSSNNHFTISPNTFPINIAPMASQVFQVTNTSEVNTQQGTIEFIHNGLGSSSSVLNVTAPPGLQPGPVFGTSATSLIFLQMPIGTVDSLPIIILNYGYLNPLSINNITSSNSYFNILPNSVPIIIPPQNFQTFYVSYISADSLQQGTIEFAHNAQGSPSILSVSSVNSQAQFSINPASLYFHLQPLSKSVWIRNSGNFDTLLVTNIISSNSNYTITPNIFPVRIPPGATKTFNVALNSSPGFQFGRIEFFHNAAGLHSKIFVSNQIINPQFEGLLIVRSGSAIRSLKFGLDSLATDVIDEIFKEDNIPPLPPPGAFDARFILPENNFSGSLNSYNDFRFGYYPFTEQKEFRLHYQQYYNNGIEISWHLPNSITGVLQDIYNGTFINIPITDSGRFIVPDPVAFNKLKMLINFNSTTPVELTSFNATVLEKDVNLNWETATETNNRGFEVERNTFLNLLSRGEAESRSVWEKIGFVSGFGTTTESKSYSFSDKEVSTGKYKYRLKQIDFDGSFTYSNEIEVEVNFTPKEFVLCQNYPNPFNPSTVIKFAIPKEVLVNLSVYNLLGERVRPLKNEIMQPGNYEIQFDGSGLASGIYLYRIQAVEFVQIKKMILTK